MSQLQKKVLERKSVLPNLPKIPTMAGKQRTRDFTPVSWNNYYDEQKDLKIGQDIIRIYKSGTSGPLLFFLHGGGFSALTWSLLAKKISSQVTCRCVAMDMRGHGDSYFHSDKDILSAENLAKDVGRVVDTLYGEDYPPIVLIGHSMGGAIAVQVAYKKIVDHLAGLIVIDVVEGTAMDALGNMQTFLRNRPSHFSSVEEAIQYCCKSGQIRNIESARVSVIGQLKRSDTMETATHEALNIWNKNKINNDNVIKEEEEDDEDGIKNNKKLPSSETKIFSSSKPFLLPHSSLPPHPSIPPHPSLPPHPSIPPQSSIPPHPSLSPHSPHSSSPALPPSSSSSSSSPFPPSSSPFFYTWRINLSETEPYWKGWFEGLSSMFLASSPPKMLMLAGVDRLDKDLTVGQMQGKFQLELLPQCGHAVHEDSPNKVADKISNFLIRYKLTQPI